MVLTPGPLVFSLSYVFLHAMASAGERMRGSHRISSMPQSSTVSGLTNKIVHLRFIFLVL